MEDKNIMRVIDANLNRLSEGLRVLEEVDRFIMDNKDNSQELKSLRHKIASIRIEIKNQGIELLNSRNSRSDVGRNETSASESNRGSIEDIVISNFKRVQEACRVLEEFLKLQFPDLSKNIKDIRYQLYDIESRQNFAN